MRNKTGPIKIGIDLDDVLGEFVPEFFKYHNKQYETTLTPRDMFSYNFWDVLQISQEETKRRVDAYAREHMYAMPLVDGAQRSVEILRSQYDELHVITARSKEFVEVTEAWLEAHYPAAFAGVHFAEHYTDNHREKGDICNEFGIQIIIDDSLSNVITCIAPGRKVLLFDAPWNQLDEQMGEIERVFSWQNILETLG